MTDKQVKAKQAYYKRYNRVIDYKLIKDLYESGEKWNITFMCKHLEISRAAYYKWVHSCPTEKQLEDEHILIQIIKIAASNNSLFGAMNMYYKLLDDYHFTCGHNRVYRIMCIHDIKSSYRRSSRYKYIKSTPEETSKNILKRNFNANKPNQ